MATYIYRTVSSIRIVYTDPEGVDKIDYIRKLNQKEWNREHPGCTIKHIDKKLTKMKLSMEEFMRHATEE